MWKEYSSSYIRHNRASSASIIIAAFVSALLLSLLCSLFYNLWIYEIARLEAEEGDWQGRLTGEMDSADLDAIWDYRNVERAVVNEALSDEEGLVVDICLKNKRSILTDMPRIAELAGLSEEAVSYHYSLLNLYLIRDSGDPALRWVFPFALAVVGVACVSLILVIHNAFAVTMNARIHQFGIFSSIGATPGQIRTCLLQEAFALCTVPVILGIVLGIFLAMGVLEGTNVLLAEVEGRLEVPFGYHPLILAVSFLAAMLTVGISAWIPARKLSRLTPLQAIRDSGELQLRRKKASPVLSFLFGVEGELAGNALKAQRKAMRTATVSLTLSFLAFSFMMCFITVTIISQRESYFERYQDAWDVMVTLKDRGIETFAETDAIQGLPGVRSAVAYQKASARRIVTQEEISRAFRETGGFEKESPYVVAVDGGWLVNAPLVILDDASFLEYCGQVGASPGLDGAVILNRTLDATDPNFRKRRSLPYLTGDGRTTVLRQAGQEETAVELPVLGYAQEPPALREEYGTLDFYELVHFIPVSCWNKIRDRIGTAQADTTIRILAEGGATWKELDEIEEEVSRLLGQYDVETENRVQDRRNNDNMMAGMKGILSLFCVLLAVIGIGNVFSNTFGFVRQRRREFARLLSIGLTPGGIRKIFCVEALVIAGRPVLITLPIVGMAVVFFLRVSYLEPMLFLKDAPFVPILIFVLAIFGFVALAYYLGAKRVLGSNLVDSLRDDTVM